MKRSTLLLPLFTAAALLAQSETTTNPSQESASTHSSHKSGHHRGNSRLSQRLNLTPQQDQQVRGFFRQANEEAKPIRDQLRQRRSSLFAAIKANSEQQIDQITQQDAGLKAQLQAIHAKSMAKVFSILTPDQQARFDVMHSRTERFGRRRGNG